MSRIAKFILILVLLLAISLPIVSSVSASAAVVTPCGIYIPTCYSGDGDVIRP